MGIVRWWKKKPPSGKVQNANAKTLSRRTTRGNYRILSSFYGSRSLLRADILSSLNAATHRQRSRTPSTGGKSNLELASIRRSKPLTIAAVVRCRSKLIRGSLS